MNFHRRAILTCYCGDGAVSHRGVALRLAHVALVSLEGIQYMYKTVLSLCLQHLCSTCLNNLGCFLVNTR